MADRKISELSYADGIAGSDIFVVVTGVDIQNATLTTHKFPLSGITNNLINIDELFVGGTGLHVQATTYTDGSQPNTIRVDTTGLAYANHEHTYDQISNFGEGVSGLVQQIIAYQSLDAIVDGATDGATHQSTDLNISLAANSKYVCELGLVLVSDEDVDISGAINADASWALNYTTKIAGTWNHLEPDSFGHAPVHNSFDSIAGTGLICDGMKSAGFNRPHTLINKFTAETTNSVADNLSFTFAIPSTSAEVKILKGSWFKAEKII